jgi:hypothetical protein
MPDYTPEQFVEALSKRIAQKRNSLTDHLTAVFLETVLNETPIENGHAHQAWISGADQAAEALWQSGRIERTAEKHRTKASGDPEAEKAGKGTVSRTKTQLIVTIWNKLPFVRKLEYGLPITVGDRGGNRGPKRHGAATIHELYAPRLPNGKGSWATGFLMWKEGGTWKFSKVRRPPATGAFAKALAAVREAAKRFKES